MNLGSRHLSLRRRNKMFPAKGAFKKCLDYLMYCIGIAQPFALVPQIIAIYAHHQTAGISISTWLLLGACNALWALYGLVHKDRIILLANLLMTGGDVAIVVGVLAH